MKSQQQSLPGRKYKYLATLTLFTPRTQAEEVLRSCFYANSEKAILRICVVVQARREDADVLRHTEHECDRLGLEKV